MGRRERMESRLARKIPSAGDLGCVANTGVRDTRFGKCGNRWTYGRILGSVARKGLREIVR